MRLIICVPVFNEGPAIPSIVDEIMKLADILKRASIIVINDGSSDSTNIELSKISHERVTAFKHPCNMGVGDCLLTGIRIAREAGAISLPKFLSTDIVHLFGMSVFHGYPARTDKS
uniref:Glycosyl transferase family 2 n=1 Tax=Candidatus Kentrum sp. DK TaxID=2126562 RepID=A0A450SET3_9GAMM|nr:MAG: Glycosyl transferase family 2 [Candidatus Kentron sp. DK]